MNPNPPDDLLQREKALDITLSCCVQAPAGSGKTELLTQRILKLLAVCERPEDVLAITFTRKAAAEMRNRLLAYLEEAEQLSEAEFTALKPHNQQTIRLARAVLARDAELGWALQANTNRLRINTIDSFNQFLVAQLPVTSALGMLPNVTEKPTEIFREAIRETLKELDSSSALSQELAVLLGHLNNQWFALEKLFCSLLFKRDQWLGYILAIKQDTAQTRSLMEHTLRDIVETILSELDTALSPYLPRLLPVLRFAAANLATEGNTSLREGDLDDSLPGNQIQNLEQWRAVVAMLLTEKPALRKTVVAAQGFPAQTAPGSKEEKAFRKLQKDTMLEILREMAMDELVAEKLEAFYYLPEGHFNNSQWQVLESLTAILPQLVGRLNLIFARHQLTDYPHISAAALEALGEEHQPTDLALRLDYSLKHILVDEFQDTSTSQIELLKKLTHGWTAGDGRTLFIVGDGMQSCYGFRNARVGLFLAARDTGIGEVLFEDLRLSANFRSEAALVTWVNDVFEGAFPEQDDISRGGVRFNPATTVHANSAIAGVKTTLINADKDLELGKQRLQYKEALIVAETIEAIQKDFPEESIAVLVRSRNQLNAIIPVLRQRNLQWNASEIDPLLSYPEIRDLLSLVRAILNPADTIAWLALLRSPMVGLRLADIHCLSHQARLDDSTVWQTLVNYNAQESLSAEAITILDRIMPPLKVARQQRQRLPLRDLVENLWLLLGGPACLENPSLVNNVVQFFALLEEHDKGGDITDIHLFETELAALFGGGMNPSANLHIMTIHKAKGLEFHHVILPGLERLTGRNDNPLLLWKEHITATGDKSLVMSIPAQKGSERENDAVYRYLKYEIELEQSMETTRLLYIAVTRAIRQAHLLCSVMTEKGEYKAPAKKSLLSSIWSQLLARSEQSETNDIFHVSLDENSPLPPAQQLAESGNNIRSRRLAPNWQNSITVINDEEGSEPDNTFELAHHHMLEKQTGEILHYCLMLASQGKLDLGNNKQLEKLEAVWRRQLGPLTENLEQAINTVHKQLQACQQHEKFSWLVHETHQDQASELALSDYARGSRRDYIIDRTFIDNSGTRWIIDYKSSNPAPDESMAAFIARQEQLHSEQLDKYARLFAEMENLPQRKALFFTALPCFHELDARISTESSQKPLF